MGRCPSVQCSAIVGGTKAQRCRLRTRTERIVGGQTVPLCWSHRLQQDRGGKPRVWQAPVQREPEPTTVSEVPSD